MFSIEGTTEGGNLEIVNTTACFQNEPELFGFFLAELLMNSSLL